MIAPMIGFMKFCLLEKPVQMRTLHWEETSIRYRGILINLDTSLFKISYNEYSNGQYELQSIFTLYRSMSFST